MDLSPQQIASFAGVSDQRVIRWIRRDRLHAMRYGNRWRVDPQHLREWASVSLALDAAVRARLLAAIGGAA